MTELIQPFKVLHPGGGCRCSNPFTTEEQTLPKKGDRVEIDGRVFDLDPMDKNIVETAGRAGIAIPSPCYSDPLEKKGCCGVCVVEVNGAKTLACGTIPQDGMQIVVDRDDLNLLRKKRLADYRQ